jgi:hypothetical protein
MGSPGEGYAGLAGDPIANRAFAAAMHRRRDLQPARASPRRAMSGLSPAGIAAFCVAGSLPGGARPAGSHDITSGCAVRRAEVRSRRGIRRSRTGHATRPHPALCAQCRALRPAGEWRHVCSAPAEFPGCRPADARPLRYVNRLLRPGRPAGPAAEGGAGPRGHK